MRIYKHILVLFGDTPTPHGWICEILHKQIKILRNKLMISQKNAFSYFCLHVTSIESDFITELKARTVSAAYLCFSCKSSHYKSRVQSERLFFTF